MYELPNEDSARSFENKQHVFGRKRTLITQRQLTISRSIFSKKFFLKHVRFQRSSPSNSRCPGNCAALPSELQIASVPLRISNRCRSIILIGHISWFSSIQGRNKIFTYIHIIIIKTGDKDSFDNCCRIYNYITLHRKCYAYTGWGKSTGTPK